MKIPSGFVPFRGAWKVQPYGHRISQQHVLAQNSVSATRPLILMTQPMSRMDKMFVKVRLESGSDMWAGLVLCCSRDQPQLVLRVQASRRELEFVVQDGTTERIAARHEVPVKPREWYRLAVEVDETRTLTATVNRRNAVRLQIPKGYIWRLGLETNTGTMAYFDDFGYEGVW